MERTTWYKKGVCCSQEKEQREGNAAGEDCAVECQVQGQAHQRGCNDEASCLRQQTLIRRCEAVVPCTH